jgi:phosphoglycerate dehydrogenase-like enzyme
MSQTLVLLPPQRPVTREWAVQLRTDVPGLVVEAPESPAEALQVLPAATAAYGRFTPELLAAAANVSWLQIPSSAAHADYYFPELIEHPLQASLFHHTMDDYVSTHAVLLALALVRNLKHYLTQQLQRVWVSRADVVPVAPLAGMVAMVVGVGGIGSEVARLLSAFGPTIIGVDAKRTDTPPGVAEMHHPDELAGLLPRVNLLILTMPHTPDTEGMFGDELLSLLPMGSYLVNTARGATLRLDAVIRALKSGRLAGAGLDVAEQEPLPPDHPLWDEENVIITPHVAGIGLHIAERQYEILRENARRFVAGEPLLNIIDKRMRF